MREIEDPYADVRNVWQKAIEATERKRPKIQASPETILRLKMIAEKHRKDSEIVSRATERPSRHPESTAPCEINPETNLQRQTEESDAVGRKHVDVPATSPSRGDLIQLGIRFAVNANPGNLGKHPNSKAHREAIGILNLCAGRHCGAAGYSDDQMLAFIEGVTEGVRALSEVEGIA